MGRVRCSKIDALCGLATTGYCNTIQVDGADGREVRDKQRYGPPKKQIQIMAIAEAPGKDEDYLGIPLVGEAGEAFVDLMTDAAWDKEATWCTNSARCRPPGNRNPSVKELAACKGYLVEEIKRLQPRVILLMGNIALRVFHLGGKGGLSKIHGQPRELTLPEWEDGPTFRVIPTYHPAYLIRHGHNPRIRQLMLNDFRMAQHCTEVADGQELKKLPRKAKYTLIRTMSDFEGMLGTLLDVPIFAFDTESTSLPFHTSPCTTASFSIGEDKNWVLPFFKHSEETMSINHAGRIWGDFHITPYWDSVEYYMVKAGLKALFENPSIAKAAHNLKYDVNVLRFWLGIKMKGFFYCTQMMHHTLDEYRPHDLENLADTEFGTGDYSAELREIVGHGKKLTKTYDHITDHLLWPYAALDAENVWKLLHVYWPRLQENPELWKLYCEEVEPGIKTLLHAEWHGSKIDRDILQDLNLEYNQKQLTLLIDMRKVTSQDFNPMSNPQVTKAICAMGFGEKIKDDKKSAGYTADRETLAAIKDDCAIAGQVLAYRTNKKILSTYIGHASQLMDDDDIIRPSFLQHGTETGRLSCPFFHQIPRPNAARKKRGVHNLRDMFIARDGYKMVYFDYCLAPNTPILKADLSWERLEKISIGDELVGIDESSGRGRHRKLRKSTVTDVRYNSRFCYLITMGDGRKVIAARHHPWLAKKQHSTGWGPYKWVETCDLTRDHFIADIGKPWGTYEDFDAGYLSGAFDGEGYIGPSTVGFGQNPGIVMDRVKDLLKKKGFQVWTGNVEKWVSDVDKIAITGKDAWRFLGSRERLPR